MEQLFNREPMIKPMVLVGVIFYCQTCKIQRFSSRNNMRLNFTVIDDYVKFTNNGITSERLVGNKRPKFFAHT